jgi:hypothetical protein
MSIQRHINTTATEVALEPSLAIKLTQRQIHYELDLRKQIWRTQSYLQMQRSLLSKSPFPAINLQSTSTK